MNDVNIDLSDAKVLIVDDVRANLKMLQDILEPQGYRIFVAVDGVTALKSAARTAPDIILLDVKMPGMDGFEVCRQLRSDPPTAHTPIVFVTSSDDEASRIQGLKLGGDDYITKPFCDQEVLLRIRNLLERTRLTRCLQEKNQQLEHEIARHQRTEQARQRAHDQLSMLSTAEAKHWGIEGFIGRSTTLRTILDQVRRLQNASATNVLISGESGTGKELIARAIHFGSDRGANPFVPVNCSAIPGELAESALFGHVRGAFTGAQSVHPGYFVAADQGTLFLDEIGDMPLHLQAKLLRVLEDGCVVPVGGTKEKRVDVRIIAASNQDVPTLLAAGQFRQDLYFRLAGFTVTVAPLRDRREDIALLAEHFLHLYAADMGILEPVLSPAALGTLEAYAFPGNVRELKNIIEGALIRSDSGTIQTEHLHLITDCGTDAGGPRGHGAHIPLAGPVAQAERIKELAHTPTHPQGTSDATAKEAQILAYIETHGSINNAECQALLAVDLRHASYLLNKLCQNGLLQRHGQRRWARYERLK